MYDTETSRGIFQSVVAQAKQRYKSECHLSKSEWDWIESVKASATYLVAHDLHPYCFYRRNGSL